jgi:hypothetical protein
MYTNNVTYKYLKLLFYNEFLFIECKIRVDDQIDNNTLINNKFDWINLINIFQMVCTDDFCLGIHYIFIHIKNCDDNILITFTSTTSINSLHL